jgi:hypothetical protein
MRASTRAPVDLHNQPHCGQNLFRRGCAWLRASTRQTHR